MGAILVTGASGFIGRALAEALSKNHAVVCLSRTNPKLGLPFVKGDFQSYEALQALNKHEIDAVCHLAAVTGGCSERDGILVNVEGTRLLMRYLMDRGCRKFVMASSIAAVGMQSLKFRPLKAPIPDEHPCLDRDGYGLSKYLMEEVTRYYQRQNEDIDVVNLRLASIYPDGQPRPLRAAGPKTGMWAEGGITQMSLSDAVRAFTLAAEAPRKPGVRVMNAAAPKAWVKDPMAKVLRAWYGDGFDVSHYEQPGHEFDSVYDVGRIEDELGFVARVLPPAP